MQSRVRGTIEAVAIKNLQELLRKKGITAEALFTKYDLDGNGSIDHSEFKAALESITGQQAPDAILSAIFSAVDTNTDGTLNLEEILTLDVVLLSDISRCLLQEMTSRYVFSDNYVAKG